MIVLDTNVFSELIRTVPNPRVYSWFHQQRTGDRYITAVSLAEMMSGILLMPVGRKREALQSAASSLLSAFESHVIAFDEYAAMLYGEVLVARKVAGRPIGIPDAMIAAICLQQGATLATRNTKDFLHTGVDLIDPWEDIHD